MSEVQEQVKTLSLFKKLCEVGLQIGWVEKTGRNQFHGYAYATEADLVSRLRGELYKRGVFIYPSAVSCERIAITVTSAKGERQTALTDLMMRWTFVDADSNETFFCDIPGCGEDSSDKGVYKAMTGSEKYMLMKSFLIPTGDDPEADTKDEKKQAFSQGKAAAQAVAQQKIAEHNARNAVKPKTTKEESAELSPSSINAQIGEPRGNSSQQQTVAPRSISIIKQNGKYLVFGSGLPHLLKDLNDKDVHFKNTFMKYDPEEGRWLVQPNKAFVLVDFCHDNGYVLDGD